MTCVLRLPPRGDRERVQQRIVEKSSEVGAHIISGNVFETKALDELLPDWKEMDWRIIGLKELQTEKNGEHHHFGELVLQK